MLQNRSTGVDRPEFEPDLILSHFQVSVWGRDRSFGRGDQSRSVAGAARLDREVGRIGYGSRQRVMVVAARRYCSMVLMSVSRSSGAIGSERAARRGRAICLSARARWVGL